MCIFVAIIQKLYDLRRCVSTADEGIEQQISRILPIVASVFYLFIFAQIYEIILNFCTLTIKCTSLLC